MLKIRWENVCVTVLLCSVHIWYRFRVLINMIQISAKTHFHVILGFQSELLKISGRPISL